MSNFKDTFKDNHTTSQLLKFLSHSDRSHLGQTSQQFNETVNQPTAQQKIYLSSIDFKHLTIEISNFIKAGEIQDNAYIIRKSLSTLRKLVIDNNGTPPVAIDEINYQGDEKYLVFAFIFGLKNLTETEQQRCLLYASGNLSLALKFSGTKPISWTDLLDSGNYNLNDNDSSFEAFLSNLNTDLIFLDLQKAIFHNAFLFSANLSYANLSSADLSCANLIDATLSSADLSNANLSGAQLWSAELNSATLSSAVLSNANLKSAILRDAHLMRADLTGADLTDANLRGANLRGANLSNADLINANLIGANLSGVNFDNTNLSGVKFVGRTFKTSLAISLVTLVTASIGFALGFSAVALLWPVALAVSGAAVMGCGLYYANRSRLFQRVSTYLAPEHPAMDSDAEYQRL